jgi:dipeptidyl aminopeptidase/acylaminoacyl peptidase
MTIFATTTKRAPGGWLSPLPIPCLCAAAFFWPLASRAQEKPTLRIDEDVTSFAFSGSGRIAYGARHVFSVKKIQLQRDDIWIAEPDGKKRRILLGEKFVRGTGPFSYTVRALRWAPDGSKLAVELGTSEMINDDGDTREGVLTLLLDDTGREIQIEGGDSTIPGASNPAWMADGATVVYLTGEQSDQKPSSDAAPATKVLAANFVNPSAGGKSSLFAGHLFSAAVWDPDRNAGVAIEHAANHGNLAGPAPLVALDPIRNVLRTLATLEGYAGGLTVSPSGKRLAYWVNNEQLEVRDMDSPDHAARVRIALGTVVWGANEARVVVKRGPLRRSGDLVLVTLPSLNHVAAGSAPKLTEVVPQSILHGLEFRGFDTSPDGRSLAVVEPGRRNLYMYPLP